MLNALMDLYCRVGGDKTVRLICECPPVDDNDNNSLSGAAHYYYYYL